MTASMSVIRICNLALLSIGARTQISSLSEGSTEANACNQLYQFVYENLARTADWNCLRQQVTLTLLAAAEGTPENPDGTTLPQPPSPYLYSYAVPSDSLQIRYVLPLFPNSSPTGASPLTTASVVAATYMGQYNQIPFAVAYSTDSTNSPIQIILCNETQAQAVYTINQSNPIIFDSMFTSAMIASLAAYLVPALSLNLPLMDRAIKQAEGMIAQARVRDGDEGYTSQNRQADWMVARNQGGSIGWWGTGDGMGLNYNGIMPWPGS